MSLNFSLAFLPMQFFFFNTRTITYFPFLNEPMMLASPVNCSTGIKANGNWKKWQVSKRFSNACRKTNLNGSKLKDEPIRAPPVTCARRGRNCVYKVRSVLVLHIIGWKTGARFLSQRSNRNLAITFNSHLKTALIPSTTSNLSKSVLAAKTVIIISSW